MTVANFSEAKDEMLSLLKAAWDSESGAVVGYIPEIRYEAVEKADQIDRSKYWIYATIQAVDEEQATLSDCVGVPFQKRYNAAGLVFIQLFAPKSDEEGEAKLEQLAAIAKKAFRGKTTVGSIWFRNVRIKSVDPEALFYRLNVVAEYEYDEIG